MQEQTGWLDLHARFYDPTIGRFLTIDPQTESQEHLSPYHYGYDNPIRFSDPEGRMGDDCCGGVVSFVAGVGSAFRDNFGSPDGRSLYRDQVSHVGEYNSGREWGHKGSLVVSAFLIAKGIVDAGTGGAAIIASDGLLVLPGAAAVVEGVAQAGIGLNGANNAINNLQKDKGRLNAEGNQSNKGGSKTEGSKNEQKTAGESISGSLKKSKSYHEGYAGKTLNELQKAAKTDQKAKQMLKLMKESDRLLEKVKSKGR